MVRPGRAAAPTAAPAAALHVTAAARVSFSHIYPAAWPVKQSKHGIIRTYRVIQQKYGVHARDKCGLPTYYFTVHVRTTSCYLSTPPAAQPLSRSAAFIGHLRKYAEHISKPHALFLSASGGLVPGCCSCRSCCIICKAMYMVSDQSVSLIIGRGEARREEWERIGSTPIFLCQRVVRPSTERA